MLNIDGSTGGGQILRTALSLAICTNTAVGINNVRAARPEPGLRPQHLAVVKVLAAISNAEVSAVEAGSTSLTFDPGRVVPGSYSVDVGTAGSVLLVFDAVLPLATVVPEPVTVTATGGTDVKWSPTARYVDAVKLPLLRSIGLNADLELERNGFYPAGGGEATLRIAPSTPSALTLSDRGELTAVDVYSKASRDLADPEVAERQRDAAREHLAAAGHPVDTHSSEYVGARSTGSAIHVGLSFTKSRAGFDQLGAPGTPAETVGKTAAVAASEFLKGTAAVDRFMADQLLVYIGRHGGRVRIPEVTDHVRASRDLLDQFDMQLDIEPATDGYLVENRSATVRD